MLSVAKKTTPHFASPSLCPDLALRSKGVGYLLQEDFSMPGFATARLKTELFELELPARKGCLARSKPAPGRIRPPVASAQWSRLHFGCSARMAEACRVFSPIAELPAKSSSTYPDSRVPAPDFGPGVPGPEPIRTDHRQNFA